MKRLPIGISTLKKIIEGNFLYIDKTSFALDLIENSGGYYFLSRPRRFGKSLFLDTLKTIFQGEKKVFKGLFIYDQYTFESYPIITINFNDGKYTTIEDYNQYLYESLDTNQRHLKISCPKDFSMSGCFKRLIEEAYNKYHKKVVILIDEYDKPILDNIENPIMAGILRDELKNFYSIIKGADEYLKFVFITGVSKFSKVSLFSGLNNIQDITLNPNYASICGYTQNDIQYYFKDHLKNADFDKIKYWYNGYQWLGKSVYNPFDILLFIANNQNYLSYWFSTATPTFLLKLIEKNNYFLPNLESIIKNDAMLDSFDVDCIEIETLMWQTGYLTIEKKILNYDDTPLYHLTIPNNEVRIALLDSVAKFISKINNSVIIKNDIYQSLFNADFKALKKTLVSLFASIPYNNFTGIKLYQYEGYYVSVFYAYIKALGIPLVAEDVTNKGRIDISIQMPNSIIIIEFKVDGSHALQQIKDKDYPQKYQDKKQAIYLIGIEFDTCKRNINKLEFEQWQYSL